MPHSQDLERRLELLERANRRWRMAFTVAAAVLGCVLLLGAAEPDFIRPVVRAHRMEADSFLLRDEHGSVRARLENTDGGPVLEFYDDNGRVSRRIGPSGFRPLGD